MNLIKYFKESPKFGKTSLISSKSKWQNQIYMNLFKYFTESPKLWHKKQKIDDQTCKARRLKAFLTSDSEAPG